MPRRTCPSCLSAVSIQITKCPYCGATVPPEAITGSSPALKQPAGRSAAGSQAQATAARPDRVISIRAILIGLGVIGSGVVIGSVAISLLFGTVTPIDGSDSGPNGVGPYIASLIIGLGLTIYGALVAARRAGHRELVHAGIVGLVAMLVGLALLIGPWSAGPTWFVVASAVLTMPCALLGGQLARRGR